MRTIIPAGLAAIVFGGVLAIVWSLNFYNCGDCTSRETTVGSVGEDGPVRMNAPERAEMVQENRVPLTPAVARSEPVFAPVSAFGGPGNVQRPKTVSGEQKDPKVLEAIMNALELEKLQVPGNDSLPDEGPAELVINALGIEGVLAPAQIGVVRRMPRCDEDSHPVRMPYADETSTPNNGVITPDQLPAPLRSNGQPRMPTVGETSEDNSATIPFLWQLSTPLGFPALQPAFHYFRF